MRNFSVKLDDFRRYDETCKLFAKTTNVKLMTISTLALMAHLADKIIPIAHSNASEDPLGDAVMRLL